MAKTCEVCKHQYADELEHCPHCEAQAKASEPAAEPEGRADELATEEYRLPPSGETEEHPRPAPDDVIEIDWATLDSEKKEPASNEPLSGDLLAGLAEGETDSSSAIFKDLGQTPVPGKHSEGEPDSSSAVFKELGQTPVPEKRGAGEEDSGSAIFKDLGQTPVPGGQADEGEGSAVFDSGPARTPVPTAAGQPNETGEGNSDEAASLGERGAAEESESAIDLGEHLESGSGGLSSLDRMRMSRRLSKAWEEGGESSAEHGEALSGSESNIMRRAGDGASEVDLGSEPSLPDLGPGSEIRADDSEAFQIEAPSDVGEALPEGEETPAGEPVAEGAEEPLGLQDVEEGEFEIADDEEEVEAEARPSRASRAVGTGQRPVVPWLGGGAIGALAGTGVCLALAFLGKFPGAKRTPPPAPMPVAAQSPAPVPAARAVAPAEPARAYLDRGEYDRVLQEQPAANASPERLAERGEARWLAYLKQQGQKKGPIAANDPAVKQAKADLEGAKSAEGLFWLGQIQETTGDLAGARKTYESGLQQYKDDQSRRMMFQAALDRVDSASEEQGESGNTEDKSGAAAVPIDRLHGALASTVALALVGLQAPASGEAQAQEPEKLPPPKARRNPPKGQGTEDAKADTPQAAKSAEVEEAGFDFWRAMHLAREGKYAEAAEALHKAKGAHEARRFLRLRKSQNPLSDPTEEIFLRSCDEMAAAFQLRALLQEGGYKAASRAGTIKAVERLLAENREQKQAAQALQEALVKLKQDKDVAAVDPELKDVSRDIGVLLDAKKKDEARDAEVRRLLQEGKYLGEDTQDTVAAITKLLNEAKAARESLAAVARIVQESDSDAAPGDAAKSAQRLVEEKKSAEDKLRATMAQLQSAEANIEDLTRRLTEVKEAKAEARPDQPIRIPVAANVTEPELAELHYGAGLAAYSDGQYKDAAREFAQAIRFGGAYEPDARYFYYFGLAEYQLGNRKEAEDAIRRGVVLEQQNKPSAAAVNRTLERVQGEPRQFLNSLRP